MNTDITSKLEVFFHQFTQVSFKDKDMLINGAEPSGAFYLESGFVRQYVTTSSGTDILLNLYKPGTFFPMHWVVGGQKNHYYFQAVGEVSAWRAPKDKVLGFLQEEPEIVWDLLVRIFSGLEATLDRMEQVIDGSAQSKVVLALLIMARRFGHQEGDAKVIIDLQVKQDILASLAGVTKETFSRQLSQLRKKKLISTGDKGMILENTDVLEGLLA